MKENEIRPQNIFNEYLKLAEQDVTTYFENAPRIHISCPACGAKGVYAFNKKGFSYEECSECLTLFVSPRPAKEAFDHYYTDSPSTRYWATTFYKETESARREKLWKPKARLIKEKVERFSQAKTILDIGGGYGTFAEEIQKIMDLDIVVIEPSVHLAKVCRDKGLSVMEQFLEDISPDLIPKETKAFVSFELFEHLHDPTDFLGTLNGLMQKNDLFIFTTLSGMGIDIQVLWENSKSISPPHHLNFFNPKSVQILLKRLDFKVIEITTPGKLDISIMENNSDLIHDRFWRNYLQIASEQDKENMQAFVAQNLLSSHMMVVCSKK
ncbi:MAG: class I SAM-dependent methyltransferase [Pseudomonadota bacterium]